MRRAILIVVTLASFAAGQTGVRMKRTSGVSFAPDFGQKARYGQVITYAQGGRVRTEFWFPRAAGEAEKPPMISIHRCDTRVTYNLDLQNREYMESVAPTEEELRSNFSPLQPGEPETPNYVFDTKTVDTGEEKKVFGHTAHHYVTTNTTKAAAELGIEPTESVEDLWVLDVPDPTECPGDRRPRRGSGTDQTLVTREGGMIAAGETVERVRPEFRYTGPDPHGLILKTESRSKSANVLQTGEKQTHEMVSSSEIVEYEERALDAALFEVPKGFKKVDRLRR